VLGSGQEYRSENECSRDENVRWMSGLIREYRIGNEYVKGSIGEALIMNEGE